MTNEQFIMTPPDLSPAAVENTLRATHSAMRMQPLPQRKYKAASAPKKRRANLASHLIFLTMMSAALLLSGAMGVAAGLCLVVLMFAFMIAPISAPFFVAGAAVALGLFYLQRLASRVAATANQKAREFRTLGV
jgi:hypothetical protein